MAAQEAGCDQRHCGCEKSDSVERQSGLSCGQVERGGIGAVGRGERVSAGISSMDGGKAFEGSKARAVWNAARQPMVSSTYSSAGRPIGMAKRRSSDRSSPGTVTCNVTSL